MKILGIETSCDETALCIIDAEGDLNNAKLNVEGNSLLSQIDLHREFGGVYPSLAKREHSKNIAPMLERVLKKAGLYQKASITLLSLKEIEEVKKVLEREPQLAEILPPLLNTLHKPKIDKLAVTVGPGLEPALWVGINFAKAISIAWHLPIIPINHMEGHIFSALLQRNSHQNKEEEYTLKNVEFPALALLISGGHTELVLMREWGDYKVIGRTKDDALGEAFDKVARMLDLPYPGGPEISKFARSAREEGMNPEQIQLPRPMLSSGDLNFSFSGIKTAVMYKLKQIEQIDEKVKKEMALEFEDAVTEVLTQKAKNAIEENSAQALIVGGGVSANEHIRSSLQEITQKQSGVQLHLPPSDLSIDNAVMIAAAGYIKEIIDKNDVVQPQELAAEGNLAF